VTHRVHHDDFRLTSAVIVRLSIFVVVVFGLIYYFSQVPSSLPSFDPTLSIDETTKSYFIPKISQIIPKSDIIIITQKFDWLKNEIAGFPQKQIEEIKKSVIQSIYDDLMKK
jgi:hypothetical protein